MLKRTIETAARARLTLPVVLLVALATIAVNEATYQHSDTTLKRAIVLTDARIQAARTLQALTDVEAAARAYLVSGEADDRARYATAAASLPALEGQALALVSQVGGGDSAAAARLRQALDEHVQQMGRWVDLAQTGDRARALGMASSDIGRLRLQGLRAEFSAVLDQAESTQQAARVSLFDAMQINRIAAHMLVLLAVLALALFVRQLRRFDGERALEQQRLESQIRERTAELRELAGHLVHAREDERSRVARELHDEMGGLLTAMKLEFARLRRVPGLPQAALERAEGIEARLNDGIALKRRIVENLRPSSLDQLGLSTALRMLCEDMAQASGLRIEAELAEVVLDKDAELSLFRLVQESLNNAAKYASARRVQVDLHALPECAELVVKDDGRGFDPAAVKPGHHGLLGMRVRVESHGGTLDIDSAPGHGTRIVARLPLGQAEPAVADEPIAQNAPPTQEKAPGEAGFDRGLASGGASGI